MPMPPRTRPTALATLGAGLVGALLLTGCSAEPEAAGPVETRTTAADDALLSAHGLPGLDARAVIEQLDATPVAERSTELMASIRPDTLVISDASGAETSLPLPADEFYVSIAPFVDQTHECFFHSLTTCRGELANEVIDVEVIDDAGTVLVDEALTTFDNGFVGLWLPRDISGTITLEHDGRSVTAPIATGPDDPTCVTTLQLV
ncbi:MAG: hypothetical protein GX555_17850 [Actinomycetales bacterium]|nr:hypothetical protein [Actinomycetales bacterium]